MNQNQVILNELQLLTGTVTNDLDYMVYLLLRDGCYFNKENEFKYVKQTTPATMVVPDLEDWFSKL